MFGFRMLMVVAVISLLFKVKAKTLGEWAAGEEEQWESYELFKWSSFFF